LLLRLWASALNRSEWEPGELRIVNSGDVKVKITTHGHVDVRTLRNTFVPGGYIG